MGWIYRNKQKKINYEIRNGSQKYTGNEIKK